ncbi:radical SAM protein [Bradyrhizobium sp. LTSPM299]|uniref:radical SAM/SPASM domain-containing protein n=1 Tax=Bradyrhizobium sp. LTSPM299 TaxID=1619233 RepID=UPI00067936A0|nr:radical SAM protein [Bradyrhizobium sp. LTSPM299]
MRNPNGVAGEPAERPAPHSLRVRSARDRKTHVPVHVVWEITLACNLKCGHCGSRAGKRRANELSTAECLDVVRQLAAVGTREITLIGGEAYLRKDWLEIAAEIARLGMHCGLQTGARGLTRERIAAAYAAGVRAIGISLDGLRDLHDELRGVKGSHDQAIQAIKWVSEVGIEPGVNSQINLRSMRELDGIFDEIVAAGAKYWQVQLTVAMGNAVDNSEMLLQPHQIVDVVDKLAELYHRGRDVGLRLLPGNSIGYFGRHEAYWRSLTDDVTHWGGCTAGETTLGLEADGTIKSCPSLPKSHFAGGETRTSTIEEALKALESRNVRRDGNRGRSFCGSCYYWNVCRGGCTWVSHVLEGRRGDNPYCYYRATTLARRGLRERIVKVADAPDEPFAVGRFEVRLEHEDGSRAPRSIGLDDKPRKRGRLGLCQSCYEYMSLGERHCPHCGEVNRPKLMVDAKLELDVQIALDEIERHGRSILELAAAAGQDPQAAE